jgi:hypothetical protein
LAGQYASGAATTTPFYTNLVNNGLPYFNAQSQYSTSDIAQQFGQAQANQARQLQGAGSTLPSGFATQAQSDLKAQGAQAFDQSQLGLLQSQTAAQMAGAQGLNPLGSAQAATGAGSSVLGASSLNNNFWSNLFGGLIGGAASTAEAFI